jgi:hypothetical protein
MGQFDQRAQQHLEWAGLPSEPARPETAAERLADASSVDLGGLGVGDLTLAGPGAVESIVIPVPPVVEIAEPRESGEGE